MIGVTRNVLAAIAAGVFAMQVAATAGAQDWPAGKPVRILNGFPPGGASDIQARAIAARMSQNLGASFVVENKPGASTSIAARELIKSPPDGSTLMYTITVTTSQLPHFYAKPPYDIYKDFTPLGMASYSRTVLVATAKAPYNSVRELIDYARANPGKVNYGSFGLGSGAHISGELLRANAGIDIVHVPYKGSADAVRDLFAGQIQLVFDGSTTAVANARAGKVKILAIADNQRLPAIPDVPTMGEAGVPGFDVSGLEQLLGPPGMPRDLVAKINAEFVKAVRSPEIMDLLTKGGSTVVASSAEEHARIMRENNEAWGVIIRKLGIKLD
jgi:tripartite-type tricarboxylate transporter receptor subunit TctC